MAESENTGTPLPVIANVSRVVTKVIDRLSGDRSDCPLLVAAVCVEALSNFGIESRVMYGSAAWIEVLEDMSAIWAGCWGDNLHFWVATQFGEIVDLNVSVAVRKRAHDRPELKGAYAPPMIWSVDVPAFCRYRPEGVAELELTEERDRRKYEVAVAEVREKCTPKIVAQQTELEFPDEPILCPGRRILDDAQESFRHFDRALSVFGIPAAPF